MIQFGIGICRLKKDNARLDIIMVGWLRIMYLGRRVR